MILGSVPYCFLFVETSVPHQSLYIGRNPRNRVYFYSLMSKWCTAYLLRISLKSDFQTRQHSFGSWKYCIISQGACDKSARKSFSEKCLKSPTSFTVGLDLGNINFRTTYTRLWSEIPRWMTPEDDIFSGLLVRMRSIWVADVSVTLVGSLINWSIW